jgi:hypothetical protein
VIRTRNEERAMHMAMVIGGGLVLLGLFMHMARLWGAEAQGFAMAALYFLPVWMTIAVANLWVGVTKAGYTVAEEVPILAVVFGVPAVAAFGLAWWFARG